MQTHTYPSPNFPLTKWWVQTYIESHWPIGDVNYQIIGQINIELFLLRPFTSLNIFCVWDRKSEIPQRPSLFSIPCIYIPIKIPKNFLANYLKVIFFLSLALFHLSFFLSQTLHLSLWEEEREGFKPHLLIQRQVKKEKKKYGGLC